MAVDFAEYLEAKFRLDERSLNPQVREIWNAAWRERAGLRCLDLGSGTGVALRRLLEVESAACLSYVAVERDAGLLDMARLRIGAWLAEHGFEYVAERRGLAGWRGERRVRVEWVRADLLEFQPAAGAGCFDAVIAHHVMDLLPVAAMSARVANWLDAGGLFYASLNYDGQTSLFPQYADAELEERILAEYDTSMERRMERRRLGQENERERSGGARCGRRLHGAVLDAGLRVVAYGSSDWNLTPLRGTYRDADRVCLAALLDMIRDEMRRSGRFGGDALEAWHQDRTRRMECGELGMVVHQLDVLAEKA